MSLSWLVVAVHYPLDVVAGIAVGVGYLAGVGWLLEQARGDRTTVSFAIAFGSGARRRRQRLDASASVRRALGRRARRVVRREPSIRSGVESELAGRVRGDGCRSRRHVFRRGGRDGSVARAPGSRRRPLRALGRPRAVRSDR
ncbi:hypothetical protein D8S78_03410 [Natrialba swarupiae]|nr:hypothetical protein [Natrialba swarupiae]